MALLHPHKSLFRVLFFLVTVHVLAVASQKFNDTNIWMMHALHTF